ncbi:transcriptional repressor DicA [Sulfitobacter sp. THAF37]|uniref:helix-turn-helix domain-containing protein n=1 Tax=Sulfitobacter sp. THAF37 TaxID=2587855 RepID=UPI0012683B5C|nr:helix-turn-helix transcriptional regulator [Sulfitobacter sp. THAF37]QFT57216.1 transcriptional repressor DicA [Sulfitobacter sp. THAF37]
MEDEIDWYGPDAATFGDRLAAARENAGMSQGDLAKRLGVRLSTLRKWEDDLSEPRANRLSMLAGILNVSMMWLITGEGEGIGAPDTAGTDAAGVAEVMAELRTLRADLLRKAEHVGRLEKRLRRAMTDTADV